MQSQNLVPKLMLRNVSLLLVSETYTKAPMFQSVSNIKNMSADSIFQLDLVTVPTFFLTIKQWIGMIGMALLGRETSLLQNIKEITLMLLQIGTMKLQVLCLVATQMLS